MKYIVYVFMALVMLGCKENKSETKNQDISVIDFLNKKYTKGMYSMILDESNIGEHPTLSYLDCSNEGYFTVHFIPKSGVNSKYWKNDFFEYYDFDNVDLEKDDTLIREKLKDHFDDYYVYSVLLDKRYLGTSNNDGCTFENVFFKGEIGSAQVYLYNEERHNWQYLKRIEVTFLPPYADNEFFISHFGLEVTE